MTEWETGRDGPETRDAHKDPKRDREKHIDERGSRLAQAIEDAMGKVRGESPKLVRSSQEAPPAKRPVTEVLVNVCGHARSGLEHPNELLKPFLWRWKVVKHAI